MKPSHISYWWPVYSPKSQLFKANGRVQNTILHPWCAYRVTTLTKYLRCHPILRQPALLLLLNAACLAEKQKIQIFSLWFNPTRAHSWSTASGRVCQPLHFWSEQKKLKLCGGLYHAHSYQFCFWYQRFKCKSLRKTTKEEKWWQ